MAENESTPVRADQHHNQQPTDRAAAAPDTWRGGPVGLALFLQRTAGNRATGEALRRLRRDDMEARSTVTDGMLSDMASMPEVPSKVRRQSQPTDGGTAVAGAPAAPSAIPADLQQFRTHGPFPAAVDGQMVYPNVGSGGAFNARYDPASNVLSIIVNIAMTFVDGLTVRSGRRALAHSAMPARIS